jgi:hypothetical protein
VVSAEADSIVNTQTPGVSGAVIVCGNWIEAAEFVSEAAEVVADQIPNDVVKFLETFKIPFRVETDLKAVADLREFKQKGEL